MIDPTEKELIAIDEGGNCAGEYLESINKFDLSKLSTHEWHQFLRCVVGGFTESLVQQEQAIVQLPNASAKK